MKLLTCSECLKSCVGGKVFQYDKYKICSSCHELNNVPNNKPLRLILLEMKILMNNKKQCDKDKAIDDAIISIFEDCFFELEAQNLTDNVSDLGQFVANFREGNRLSRLGTSKALWFLLNESQNFIQAYENVRARTTIFQW